LLARETKGDADQSLLGNKRLRDNSDEELVEEVLEQKRPKLTLDLNIENPF
jgi:hypothetical protein